MKNKCEHKYEFSNYGCLYFCADGEYRPGFEFWRCSECGDTITHKNPKFI